MRPVVAWGAGVVVTTSAGAVLGGLLVAFGDSSGFLPDSFWFRLVLAAFFGAGWMGGGLALACSLFFRPRHLFLKGASCGIILPGTFLLLLGDVRGFIPADAVFHGALFLLPGALAGGVASVVQHRGLYGTA